MMAQRELPERLKSTPTQPGVYIMRSLDSQVLYVGKAANLRHRLQSYFGSPSGLEPKIRLMVARMADFEYIITDTETEALILENNLIKKYRPQYNARLKDDKNYPYIKIDLNEEFPQLYFTRRVQSDGARYFGPFASARSVRKTMDLLKKLFPYRSCTRIITGQDSRPCLEYYINRCVAPCIGAVDREQYTDVIHHVIMFLEGKTQQVRRDLRRRMTQASDACQFEQAAAIRDQIHSIERVMEKQKVVSSRRTDEDVVALARGKGEAWVEVFFIRQGNLIGRDHFTMDGIRGEPDSQILEEFIKQFYNTAPYVPPLILLQHHVQETLVIQKWLSQRRGSRVRLHVPQKGTRRKLMEMVSNNATEGLAQLRVKWLSNTDAIEKAMEELQEALNLSRLPRRIECYDISTIQGKHPTGSMVVFENGRPHSSNYRRFKIKYVPGVDDYAMMQEMLRRRFRRMMSPSQTKLDRQNGQVLEPPKNGSWDMVPDLVLIDGGKGHLSAALEVFLDLGISFVPLASIAKQQEELFLPHSPEPIALPRTSHGLHLVQRVRDEAHRFAVTYHRQRRSKAATGSAIDMVPGIGPKRKRLLLRRFGSVRGIREASLNAIADVPGITKQLARLVQERL